jgi:hypothetical protein
MVLCAICQVVADLQTVSAVHCITYLLLNRVAHSKFVLNPDNSDALVEHFVSWILASVNEPIAPVKRRKRLGGMLGYYHRAAA